MYASNKYIQKFIVTIVLVQAVQRPLHLHSYTFLSYSPAFVFTARIYKVDDMYLP